MENQPELFEVEGCLSEMSVPELLEARQELLSKMAQAEMDMFTIDRVLKRLGYQRPERHED